MWITEYNKRYQNCLLFLQELETIRDSSDDNISAYNAKLEQKDKIIEELKMQLTNLTKDFSSGNDQVEMQQKDEDSLRDGKFNAKVSNMPVVAEPSQIEILTNTLLEKHALLEAVTAEKNILALKVEKLEVSFVSIVLHNRKFKIEIDNYRF